MKILITWSSWHADLGGGYRKAFEKLHHAVVLFDDRPRHWTLFFIKAARRSRLSIFAIPFSYLYQRFVNRLFSMVVERERPDFVFVIKGAFFTSSTIEAIRADYRIPVVNWIIDDPKRINRFEPRTLLSSYRAYTKLFCVDMAWMVGMEGLAPQGATYLPHAADEEIYRPLGLARDIDLFFVGSVSLRYPNTEAGRARLNILNRLCQEGFQITAVAPGMDEVYDLYPALRRITVINRYTSNRETNEFYNRAKIVINLNAPQLITDFSDRLPAIALTGAFQLVDEKSQLVELMGSQAQQWGFDTLDELVTKVRYYLSRADERTMLAEKAYEIARTRHTYYERALRVLDTA